MRLTILLAAVAALANCDAEDFPSFDIFHSHCAIDVTFPGQLCASVYQGIITPVNKFNAGADPSGGTYQYYEKQAISYIWLTHLSKYGWASDVIFEPAQLGDDCILRGRSRTESTWHSAGTENYCDLWNVHTALGGYVSQQIGSCSEVPDKPAVTCSQ